MTRLLQYLVSNTVACWLIWQGAFMGVKGAENVAMVLIWLSVAGGLLYLSDDFCAKRAALPRLPKWLTYPVLLGQAGAMIWAGWVVTGVAYLIACTLSSRVDKFAKGGNKCLA
jgi:hypothetical protein